MNAFSNRSQEIWGKSGLFFQNLPFHNVNSWICQDMDAEEFLELKSLEVTLKREQSLIDRMMDHIPTGILLLDLDGQIIYVNVKAAEILRVPAEEITRAMYRFSDWKILDEAGRPIPFYAMPFARVAANQIPVNDFRFSVEPPDGKRILLEMNANPLFSQAGVLEGVITSIKDITHQQAVIRSLHQHEELLRSVIANAPIILWSIDQGGVFTLSLGSALEKIGLKPGEVVGKSLFEFYKEHPEIIDSTRRALAGDALISQTEVGGVTFDVRYSPIKDENGEISGVIGVSLDITEQKLAEKQIEQQYRRISGLQKIDIAIINNLDTSTTLTALLTEVTDQLGIDAASILLLEPDSQMLRTAACHGFRFDAPAGNNGNAGYKLGEGYAGLSALFRQKVYIPDMQDHRADWLACCPAWEEEGFTSYIALPLIAKNQVKGVLELLSRSPLRPNLEWLNYLTVLAGHVAIAIDNATLFEDLQQSSQKLSLAYDLTLEGWARALELRDKETEGHSQRVLQLTLDLAGQMGISEEKMVHIRRGALLHDIGKMGIPDSILLKEGPLSEEEWKIMRLHPVYAYDLLAPVPFLHQAIEIPYSHHEHWDGTGYPRGLKGETIPLAARIFSVIDAWDALHHDRPYRKAWPESQIIQYMREQAGKCFDPAVVKVFLRMANKHQVVSEILLARTVQSGKQYLRKSRLISHRI
jgi:PAS domain S-box-containing protein